jgi:hypothetical protein
MKDIERKDAPDVSGGYSIIGPCLPEFPDYPQWPIVGPGPVPNPLPGPDHSSTTETDL